MHTPKYNAILNRNVTATSPLRSAPKGKYYSAQEVHKILKTSYEPKLQYLMQQLEDRQQIIARLNNKLNENDQKLLYQNSIIETQLKKQRDHSQVQSFVVSTVNQIINDKTKQMWETLMGQVKQIGAKMQGEFDAKKMEAVVQSELEKMRGVVVEFIDSHKKKSNSYWQKIKQALNKLNSKVMSVQQAITTVNSKMQSFHELRSRDRETISELHNSKNVVKNLIQLKKSVENIYDNYQAILILQKGLKSRIEEQHADSIWHEPQFLKATSKLVNEQIVALEYSREEGILQSSKFEDDWKIYENVTQPMMSPIKREEANKSASDLLGLQKTTPLKGNDNSQLFSLNTSNQMNSKIHNSTVLLNYSLETRKQMSQSVRERLMELIEAKNLVRPLEVRYDQQINYLKSVQGNYLFDMKGNMFKVTPGELSKLQGQGLVMRAKSRKLSLSASKVKRTNC